MHVVGRSALRAACSSQLHHTCRIVTDVRHPPSSRQFHRSAIVCGPPKDPPVATTNDTVELGASSNGERVESEDNNVAEKETAVDDVQIPKSSVEESRPERVQGSHGSATRRASRNKRRKEVPPLALPDWFWEDNVKCYEEHRQHYHPLALAGGWHKSKGQSPSPEGITTEHIDVRKIFNLPDHSMAISDTGRKKHASELFDRMNPYLFQPAGIFKPGTKAKDVPPTARHDGPETKENSPLNSLDLAGAPVVAVEIFAEILACIQAGLSLPPPPNVEIKDIPRPDLVLHSPKENTSSYLDAIIDNVATIFAADLIVLNPEDLAQIIGDYMGENIAWSWCSTALLGYDTSSTRFEKFEDEELENQDDDFDIDFVVQRGKSRLQDLVSSLRPRDSSSPRGIFITSQSKSGSRDRRSSVLTDILSPLMGGSPSTKSTTSEDAWTNFKLNSALETIIEGAETKRSRGLNVVANSGESSLSAEPENLETRETPLIIQVNGYRELNRTEAGAKMLKSLHAVVKQHWHEGSKIMIVGTSVASESNKSLARGAITRLESESEDGFHRTIFVPPARSTSLETIMAEDGKRRIRHLNIRHVEYMIRKLASSKDYCPRIDLKKYLSPSPPTRWHLDENIWDYPFVHRIASTMFGLGKSSTSFEGPEFAYALELIYHSDRMKFQWAKKEVEHRNTVRFADEQDSKSDTVDPVTAENKVKNLKKDMTPHELSLVGGVINPSNIHITFADVRVPPETIEALKTLTTLSLIRPEAFSYGVLATDKIPGLLLYGPPGTGKTLLAKAVAKESGATVLEVSGSELNEMYVGEGEKKVKALFSLAKKLTPCVVFIDEADAIFGSRGSDSRRTSHRELINQFLREWDGMNDMSAFIMVATNRPFDIDEAILRRLPRRLLVDLPVEEDRLAILKIHLKDEILDPDVDLATLAKNTPFYSGSDLKNVCVAAALASVREENDAALAHPLDAETPYTYPEKRILAKRHFEKATGEISASISEDMSTLSAIRKFDERYGDRKGRRKPRTKLGFGDITEVEKDSDSARVRTRLLEV